MPHTLTPINRITPAQILNAYITCIPKLLLLILVLGTSTSLNAQNVIYRGTKSYSATNTWKLPTPNYSWNEGSLEVTVGKTEKAGLLMLSVPVPFTYYSIGGSVAVYLSNSRVIMLTGRLASDHADGKSTVLYSITKDQLTLLSQYDVMKIRFTIRASTTPIQSDSYTANNERVIYSYPSNSTEQIYSTAQEVSVLVQSSSTNN
jgi:hypothetical protein